MRGLAPQPKSPAASRHGANPRTARDHGVPGGSDDPCMTARRRTAAQNNTSEVLGQGRLDLPGIGPLWLAWTDAGLVRVAWADGDAPAPFEEARIYKRIPGRFTKPLKAYAKGKDVDPAREVPVDLRGTAFQREVWNALREVPRGRVRTYSGIAADIGRPRAMRAVGVANGRNPVPIVVPCHRIVGAGHTLGGYSGGLPRKRALLTLEGVKFEGVHLLPGQLALFE